MKRNLVLLLILSVLGCSRVRPIPPTPTPTPTLVATPTLAPTFTPTPPPYTTYTVKEGDSLWSIALELGVAVEALMEANDLSEDTILEVGQELLIPQEPLEEATPQPTSSPQGLIYTVKEGDSLWSIALEFGVTVEALMEANGLSEDTILDIGQELIIPQD